MAECPLTTVIKELDDITNIYAGYIRKADCLRASIIQVAGRENLKNLEDRIDDVLSVLMNEYDQDKRLEPYNRAVVLSNAVTSALAEF